MTRAYQTSTAPRRPSRRAGPEVWAVSAGEPVFRAGVPAGTPERHHRPAVLPRPDTRDVVLEGNAALGINEKHLTSRRGVPCQVRPPRDRDQSAFDAPNRPGICSSALHRGHLPYGPLEISIHTNHRIHMDKIIRIVRIERTRRGVPKMSVPVITIEQRIKTITGPQRKGFHPVPKRSIRRPASCPRR
jgi:hypothetical protein